ncbi:hypothetical protein OAM09_05180 [Candidatus Pelagibacter sp.]|nr:hypothetical protein [Candidatus Pelagibacter sp.]
MASKYNKKVYILHDFNLKLKLYNLTKQIKDTLNKRLNDQLIFISTKEIKKLKLNEKKIQIFWGNRLNRNLLLRLKNLKWIHLGSSGIDFKLKEEILKKKIELTRSNEIIAEAVVASIIHKIFFLGRGMLPLLKKNYYDRKSFDKNFDNISNIFNERALIFGKGVIAILLKKKLKAMEIKAKIVKLKSKNKIIKNKNTINDIKNSKFIINCLPLNKATYNFFDKQIFNLFQQSHFINIGRGETVSQRDLIKFLKNGKIIFAALDVFNKKDYVSPYRPLNYKSKLWKIDKIFITPHVSALSNKYWAYETELFSNILVTKIRKILI